VHCMHAGNCLGMRFSLLTDLLDQILNDDNDVC
jgi:hypothetical protein